jgi:hypothetical protein
MEFLQLLLALIERATDLCQLGRQDHRAPAILPGPVIPFAKLTDQDRDPVDLRVVPRPVGQDLGNAQAVPLLVDVVRASPESPHNFASLRSGP